MSDPTRRTGQFVWRECMTPDPERARGFYGELFGWQFRDVDMGGFKYPMIQLGERMLGGLVRLDPDDGDHPPHWISYVSVDDVDATAAKAKASGGEVGVAPMELPGVGRMSVLGDPSGAWFTAFRSKSGEAADAPERPPVGDFCWETVSATDLDAAKHFYTETLGWRAQPGPGGVDVFATASGAVVADLQRADRMPPAWLTYVAVAKLAEARTRAIELGGKVLVERVDVPQVGAIGVISDPMGAVIGLFEGA